MPTLAAPPPVRLTPILPPARPPSPPPADLPPPHPACPRAPLPPPIHPSPHLKSFLEKTLNAHEPPISHPTPPLDCSPEPGGPTHCHPAMPR